MLTNPFLHLIDRFYSFFIKIGSNLQSLFLLYMRLTWGYQFLLTGVKKLKDIEGTAAFFAKLNIPAPLFHAYEVGLIESVCGVLILIGFASRIASIPLIIVMLTALSTAHSSALSNFQFILNPHSLAFQNPYPYLIMALMVFVFGPGRVSIDAWIKRWADRQPRY